MLPSSLAAFAPLFDASSEGNERLSEGSQHRAPHLCRRPGKPPRGAGGVAARRDPGRAAGVAGRGLHRGRGSRRAAARCRPHRADRLSRGRRRDDHRGVERIRADASDRATAPARRRQRHRAHLPHRFVCAHGQLRRRGRRDGRRRAQPRPAVDGRRSGHRGRHALGCADGGHTRSGAAARDDRGTPGDVYGARRHGDRERPRAKQARAHRDGAGGAPQGRDVGGVGRNAARGLRADHRVRQRRVRGPVREPHPFPAGRHGHDGGRLPGMQRLRRDVVGGAGRRSGDRTGCDPYGRACPRRRPRPRRGTRRRGSSHARCRLRRRRPRSGGRSDMGCPRRRRASGRAAARRRRRRATGGIHGARDDDLDQRGGARRGSKPPRRAGDPPSGRDVDRRRRQPGRRVRHRLRRGRRAVRRRAGRRRPPRDRRRGAGGRRHEYRSAGGESRAAVEAR